MTDAEAVEVVHGMMAARERSGARLSSSHEEIRS